MSREPLTFRKLGSTFQGMFTASALFVDEQCLLLVRTIGYEESVQRFYFKDIQAIVVSKSNRFGVSRRATFGALLLLLGMLIARSVSPPVARILPWIAVILIIAWLYVSMRASCRCRLYTAVNQQELLSVRRQWIARRVLRELAPRIEAAQGTLPANWREAIPSDRSVVLGPSTSTGPVMPSIQVEPQPGRISGSVALVVSLMADALLTTWDLSRTQTLHPSIGSLLALVEASCAVWVLIQNRGLDPGLQRFGGAVLIFLGTVFYAQYGVIGAIQAQVKRQMAVGELHSQPLYRGFLEFYIGVCVVLCIIGAILTFAGRASQRGQLLVG